ncbi:MAG: DUF1311 domain-containing protein [Gammaproteobacteria bacterium]|nr:DUF1311 domain-containing protein [Gammaproteobacteria bacterium]
MLGFISFTPTYMLMKNTYLKIFSTLLLALPAISNGSEARDCDSTSQATLSFCAKDAYELTDVELNNTYKKLIANLKTDASKNRLKEAQRAWVLFRDKDCEYYNSGQERYAQSMATMMYYFCLTDRTKTRIKELKNFATCTQGGCPY